MMIRLCMVLVAVMFVFVSKISAQSNSEELQEKRGQKVLRKLEELLEVKELLDLLKEDSNDMNDEQDNKRTEETIELGTSEELDEERRDYSTDYDCAHRDHPDYGCVGKCIATSKCPGNHYISNLCPNKPADVKCCFTANSDSQCTSGFSDGHCIATSQCPNNDYVSNYCPTKPPGVKCCRSKPTDTCPNDGCGSSLKTKACNVKSNSNIRLRDNNSVFNSKGNNDGADATSNIADMCNGKKSKRSSYDCVISGVTVPTPGGWVCIQAKVLDYLIALANDGHDILVNTITGACHSKTSKHYSGLAVDIQKESSASNYQAWMTKCTSMGGTAYGPGDAGHANHVHCHFP
ncbi:uncharacterized protein [Amphiura filiformis]|uniref:uncharacterized protein n=1 Tax=Amphiura filiformis TaxID=82378 RepID=UPI003B21E455